MSFKPWYLLPANLAHSISEPSLKIMAQLSKPCPAQWDSLKWQKLNFRNPVGIAGGVDKNATQMHAWNKLGSGFIEVGTVTPQPQKPNPGKIMDRSLKHFALWNKMGFPGLGLAEVKHNLQKAKKNSTPLFINIGKNRDTPNDRAHEDYIKCVHELSEFADAFVVNISSPNTKGLRDLLQPKNLKSFLLPIIKDKKKPFLLKLSPDMQDEQLHSALNTSCDLGIDGWILTNTTLKRYNTPFPAEGGLSGKPLADLSKKVLKSAVKHLGPRKKDKLIISAGGVMNYKDVKQRLELGADLVQVYSALVFHGPYFFKNLYKEASKQ